MESNERNFQIKKGYDTVTKTFRFPIPIAEKLEKLAAENNISLNQLVLQCIEYAFNNLKKF